MAKTAAAASTPTAAGVRTAATGAYSDPATVGAMIQKMYPQYANFDPATLGQRWIAVHAPAPSTGTGAGIGEAGLQPPTGTTPLTTTNPNANTPDLSGLSKFATPFQQPKPIAQPKPTPLTAGLNVLNSSMGGVNTMGQMNTPYTVPVQTQQAKPQPQPSLPTSTFDISKVRF